MTSPMDFLPNEVILQIFSYLEKLEDRAVLSQVSRRFNSLSEVKTWRKKISISFDDIKKHDLYKFRNNKLVEEAKMSINLESLIIEEFECFNRRDRILKRKVGMYLPYMLCNIFKKCPRLSDVQCEIFERNFLKFSSKDDNMVIYNVHSPSRSKSFDRMITCFPVKFRFISHFGPQILLPTCLDRSSDVLEEIHCTNFILNSELLTLLMKCKKLNDFEISNSFNVESGMELTVIPKLNIQHLSLPPICNLLNEFNNHPKVLDIFMNESLKELYISNHILSGYETLVLGKCKNLETLEIVMVQEFSLPDEESIELYKNIVTLSKQFTNLTEIMIINIVESFKDKLEEELFPVVQQYGFQAISEYWDSKWTSIISKTQ